MCRRNRRRRLRLRRGRGLFVECVFCPTAGVLAVSVVEIGVVGLIGYLSLLLTTSPSMQSHFKPSCAVASQVVSFVRS